MKDIRDLVTESFGLIIAYLLPGLVGLFSLSLWSTSVRRALQTFLTANSNINLFLLVLFASLAIGMLVVAIRGFIYEYLLPHLLSIDHLEPEDFVALGQPNKLSAFLAAVEADYRFHQCWSGMSVVIPILYVGWLVNSWNSRSFSNSILPSILFILVESAAIWAAIVAYKVYVSRAHNILSGSDHNSSLKGQEEKPMPNGWGIIIRGGSVEVEFDPTDFPSDPANPKKHKNASKKITRVQITGDINFDTGDKPDGLKCEITAFYH